MDINAQQPEDAKKDGEKENKKLPPIEHYNSMLHEDFSMYDNLTYVRDLSLFDNNEVMLNRGNVIHYFNYKLAKPKKIGGDYIDAEISSEEDITEEEDSENLEENAQEQGDFEA